MAVLGRFDVFHGERVQRFRYEHQLYTEFHSQGDLEGSFVTQRNQLMEKVKTWLLVSAPFGSTEMVDMKLLAILIPLVAAWLQFSQCWHKRY